MSLTPYQIFSVSHSIFLHYNSSYDYQKYNGKSRYSEDAFDKRRDRYTYHKLAREFAAFDKELLEYYVSWQHYNREKWITSDQLIAGIPDFELEWLNYSKNKEGNFRLDMVKLHSADPKFIFEKLNQGEIHYQSLLILSKFTNIIDDMNLKLKGQPLWDFKYNKLKRFTPFYFAYDKVDDKLKQYVPEKLCQRVSQEN